MEQLEHSIPEYKLHKNTVDYINSYLNKLKNALCCY